MTDAPLEAMPRPRMRPGGAWFLLITIAVVALDQLTKWVIRANLDRGDAWPSESWLVKIVHITNSGAAFGILQGAGPLLAVTSIVGMALIFIYLFNPGFAHPVMRLGLALMLGGAIGNLIDRSFRGYVVDYLDFYYQTWSWPAFNLADIAIVGGVLLLFLSSLSQPSPQAGRTG